MLSPIFLVFKVLSFNRSQIHFPPSLACNSISRPSSFIQRTNIFSDRRPFTPVDIAIMAEQYNIEHSEMFELDETYFKVHNCSSLHVHELTPQKTNLAPPPSRSPTQKSVTFDEVVHIVQIQVRVCPPLILLQLSLPCTC